MDLYETTTTTATIEEESAEMVATTLPSLAREAYFLLVKFRLSKMLSNRWDLATVFWLKEQLEHKHMAPLALLELAEANEAAILHQIQASGALLRHGQPEELQSPGKAKLMPLVATKQKNPVMKSKIAHPRWQPPPKPTYLHGQQEKQQGEAKAETPNAPKEHPSHHNIPLPVTLAERQPLAKLQAIAETKPKPQKPTLLNATGKQGGAKFMPPRAPHQHACAPSVSPSVALAAPCAELDGVAQANLKPVPAKTTLLHGQQKEEHGKAKLAPPKAPQQRFPVLQPPPLKTPTPLSKAAAVKLIPTKPTLLHGHRKEQQEKAQLTPPRVPMQKPPEQQASLPKPPPPLAKAAAKPHHPQPSLLYGQQKKQQPKARLATLQAPKEISPAQPAPPLKPPPAPAKAAAMPTLVHGPQDKHQGKTSSVLPRVSYQESPDQQPIPTKTPPPPAKPVTKPPPPKLTFQRWQHEKRQAKAKLTPPGVPNQKSLQQQPPPTKTAPTPAKAAAKPTPPKRKHITKASFLPDIVLQQLPDDALVVYLQLVDIRKEGNINNLGNLTLFKRLMENLKENLQEERKKHYLPLLDSQEDLLAWSKVYFEEQPQCAAKVLATAKRSVAHGIIYGSKVEDTSQEKLPCVSNKQTAALSTSPQGDILASKPLPSTSTAQPTKKSATSPRSGLVIPPSSKTNQEDKTAYLNLRGEDGGKVPVLKGLLHSKAQPKETLLVSGLQPKTKASHAKGTPVPSGKKQHPSEPLLSQPKRPSRQARQGEGVAFKPLVQVPVLSKPWGSPVKGMPVPACEPQRPSEPQIPRQAGQEQGGAVKPSAQVAEVPLNKAVPTDTQKKATQKKSSLPLGAQQKKTSQGKQPSSASTCAQAQGGIVSADKEQKRAPPIATDRKPLYQQRRSIGGTVSPSIETQEQLVLAPPEAEHRALKLEELPHEFTHSYEELVESAKACSSPFNGEMLFLCLRNEYKTRLLAWRSKLTKLSIDDKTLFAWAKNEFLTKPFKSKVLLDGAKEEVITDLCLGEAFKDVSAPLSLPTQPPQKNASSQCPQAQLSTLKEVAPGIQQKQGSKMTHSQLKTGAAHCNKSEVMQAVLANLADCQASDSEVEALTMKSEVQSRQQRQSQLTETVLANLHLAHTLNSTESEGEQTARVNLQAAVERQTKQLLETTNLLMAKPKPLGQPAASSRKSPVVAPPQVPPQIALHRVPHPPQIIRHSPALLDHENNFQRARAVAQQSRRRLSESLVSSVPGFNQAIASQALEPTPMAQRPQQDQTKPQLFIADQASGPTPQQKQQLFHPPPLQLQRAQSTPLQHCKQAIEIQLQHQQHQFLQYKKLFPQIQPKPLPNSHLSQIQPQIRNQQLVAHAHSQLQPYAQVQQHQVCAFQPQIRLQQRAQNQKVQQFSTQQMDQQNFEQSSISKAAREGNLSTKTARQLLEKGILWQEHEHVWNQNLDRLQKLYQVIKKAYSQGKDPTMNTSALDVIKVWASVQGLLSKHNALPADRKLKFDSVMTKIFALQKEGPSRIAVTTATDSPNVLSQVNAPQCAHRTTPNKKRSIPSAVPAVEPVLQTRTEKPCLETPDRKAAFQGNSPVSVVDGHKNRLRESRSGIATVAIDLTEQEEDDEEDVQILAKVKGIEDDEERQMALEGKLPLATAKKLIDNGAHWKEGDETWEANFEKLNTVNTLLQSSKLTGQAITVHPSYFGEVRNWMKVQAVMYEEGMLPPQRHQKFAKLASQLQPFKRKSQARDSASVPAGQNALLPKKAARNDEGKGAPFDGIKVLPPSSAPALNSSTATSESAQRSNTGPLSSAKDSSSSESLQTTALVAVTRPKAKRCGSSNADNQNAPKRRCLENEDRELSHPSGGSIIDDRCSRPTTAPPDEASVKQPQSHRKQATSTPKDTANMTLPVPSSGKKPEREAVNRLEECVKPSCDQKPPQAQQPQTQEAKDFNAESKEPVTSKLPSGRPSEDQSDKLPAGRQSLSVVQEGSVHKAIQLKKCLLEASAAVDKDPASDSASEISKISLGSPTSVIPLTQEHSTAPKIDKDSKGRVVVSESTSSSAASDKVNSSLHPLGAAKGKKKSARPRETNDTIDKKRLPTNDSNNKNSKDHQPASKNGRTLVSKETPKATNQPKRKKTLSKKTRDGPDADGKRKGKREFPSNWPVLNLVDDFDFSDNDPVFKPPKKARQDGTEKKGKEPYDPQKNTVWFGLSKLDQMRLISHTPKMPNYYSCVDYV